MTSETLNVPYLEERNGMSFRCKITDTYGDSVWSNSAVLKYRTPLAITSHPTDVIVYTGLAAVFCVKATGDGLTYQWQYKSAGASEWYNYIGMTSDTLNVPYLESQNGMNVRCVITDSEGNQVVSDVATLTYTISYTYTPTASDEIERTGDIDGDGSITAKDVTILRRYLAGGWGVTIDATDADINGDSEINAKDVTMLRRYLAGGWGVELAEKDNMLT
jgi:hypothetical protein